MVDWTPAAWNGLLILVVLIHVVLAPFTKVEESFNVQVRSQSLRPDKDSTHLQDLALTPLED
jgi:hypothetical protein